MENNQHIHLIETCPSTNDAIWALTHPRPFILYTNKQTAGRGRGGNTWQSDSNTLTASYIADVNISTKAYSWISLAAGLATYQSLHELTNHTLELSIKWPNDIYIGASKLAGLLCESRISDSLMQTIVIGLGVNFFSAPIIKDVQTTCITQHYSFDEWFDNNTIKYNFINIWFRRLNSVLLEIKSESSEARGTIAEQWLQASRSNTRYVLRPTNISDLVYSDQIKKIDKNGHTLITDENGELVVIY